jgi:peroxiredoxin
MTINKPILYYPFFLFLLLAFISKSDDPKGLSVGAIAPKFDATDQFGKQYDLEEQLKNGPVVLMFYRGHWCKYCNRQLEQLSDSLEFIFEKGASVVTVTPEVMEFVDETSRKFNRSFRIISDTDMKIMNAYKVTFKVNNGTNTKYKISGIKLDEFNGDNGANLPVPATYIINQDGTIKYAFFNENYKKRVSVETILMNL